MKEDHRKEDQRIEALKDIDLFRSLTSAELHQVRDKVIIKSFGKNEIILREEETNEYMYIILDGEAKVTQSTDAGKEIIMSVHKSGEFFGELSLIDGKTVPATVCATRACTTAIISKENFHILLYSQEKVAENMLKILCSRLRQQMKKIQILNFNNAAQRIKMLLLMLSENYGEKTEKGTMLKIRLIHQDIAAMTGLSRETVTRVLDKLKRNGEIKILKNRHILLQPEFESIPL
jgi:CRP/FNR family cyclic AMP-dependent transcriptional regulator